MFFCFAAKKVQCHLGVIVVKWLGEVGVIYDHVAERGRGYHEGTHELPSKSCEGVEGVERTSPQRCVHVSIFRAYLGFI
jgi:hypothetical protein